MAVLFANNATTTLASGITNVATSLTVAAGTGALFPTLSGGNTFYATLVDASNNIEIVQVTARSTDTFTIVRAQEGTTGRAFSTGHKVELRLTAAGLDAKLDKTGGTMTGGLTTVASATGGAGLNVPHGTAPTSPVNGDIWTTSTDALVRLGGVTYPLGFRKLILNTQSSTYTLALVDEYSLVYSQNSGAQVINIPTNATTAIGIGAVIPIINDGTASISLTPAGGVTLKLAGSASTGTRTIAANAAATLVKVGTDRWFVSGAGVS